MVNSCPSTSVSIEERLHPVEQTLLKITKQIQTLTQDVSQFRAPLPKGNLGVDSQPIEGRPGEKGLRISMQSPQVQAQQKPITQFKVPITQAYNRMRKDDLMHPEELMLGYRSQKHDPNE